MMYQPMVMPLPPELHDQARALYRRAPRLHNQVDWRSFDGWLANPQFCCWITQDRGEIRALLGASIHRPADLGMHVASWLRFMIPATSRIGTPDLEALWEALRDDLHSRGVSELAILTQERWASGQVERWGFQHITSVITLERRYGWIPAPPDLPLRIRPAVLSDFDAIAYLDAQAFGPLWHYNWDMIQSASLQAASFKVLEDDGMLLGYQLSTRHMHTAHLARLAIAPPSQGLGYGALLVGDMIRECMETGVSLITVNTQEDNIHSQHLYQRMGFSRTGDDAPVWRIALG